MELFRIHSRTFLLKFLEQKKTLSEFEFSFFNERFSSLSENKSRKPLNDQIFLPLFRYLVSVSYLEIYNEEIRDLLGKDREKSLDVNPKRKRRFFELKTFELFLLRLKNVRMLVSTPMDFLHILVIQLRKWKL